MLPIFCLARDHRVVSYVVRLQAVIHLHVWLSTLVCVCVCVCEDFCKLTFIPALYSLPICTFSFVLACVVLFRFGAFPSQPWTFLSYFWLFFDSIWSFFLFPSLLLVFLFDVCSLIPICSIFLLLSSTDGNGSREWFWLSHCFYPSFSFSSDCFLSSHINCLRGVVCAIWVFRWRLLLTWCLLLFSGPCFLSSVLPVYSSFPFVPWCPIVSIWSVVFADSARRVIGNQ